MLYFLILLFFVCIATEFITLAKYKNTKISTKKLVVILSTLLFAVTIIKSFAADGFSGVINGGELIYHESEYIDKIDILESLIRWLFLVFECLLLSLLVSKNNKGVKWILSYICLPFISISLFYFPRSVEYFLKPVYLNGFYPINNITAAILSIFEYLLLYSSCLIIHLFDDCKIKEKTEIKQTIKVGIFSLFICIPFLVLPSIFGTTDIKVENFNFAHIAWIISVPLLLIIILLLFKKESQDVRFTVIALMVFYITIHYFSSYKIGYRSNRAPFQLCNFAVILFVIALFTKWQKLFNFFYIANPAGCIVAILVNDKGYLFGFWAIHYIIEHTLVFIIPILFKELGYFKKPSIKELLRDFFTIFSVYFTFCILYNGIHNGLVCKAWENENINIVNFFFLVKCPLEGVVSFYPYLECVPLNIFGQTMYLGYLAFVYIVYSLISLSLYFIPLLINKLISKTRKEKIKTA